MGPKIHRNHHNVVFLLHFLKTVCPILRHARVFCTETLPNFLHHEGAGLHHLVAMCSMCVHATKNKTCINSINMCNAMHRYVALFPLKILQRFLRSVEICVQHWIFLVCIEKHWVSVSSLFSTSLRSRMVEKDVCGQNGAVRKQTLQRNSQKTYIASAPLLQRGARVLAESLTSHWDA